MLWCDRGGYARARAAHELHRLARGDMFEHNSQSRPALAQRRQHALDEARLAIKHVDAGVGDFPVHLQWHVERTHGIPNALEALQIRDRSVRMRRGARRVELAADDRAAAAGALD